VFDAVVNPRSGSRMIIAVAGSGKTTTIKNALRYLPPGASVQLFAFNTPAAKSLKDGLAEIMAADGDERYVGVRAGTFHSVGYAALLRHSPVRRRHARQAAPGLPGARVMKRCMTWLCSVLVLLFAGASLADDCQTMGVGKVVALNAGPTCFKFELANKQVWAITPDNFNAAARREVVVHAANNHVMIAVYSSDDPSKVEAMVAAPPMVMCNGGYVSNAIGIYEFNDPHLGN
jgi:superfamily I DNA/RNA helicase